MADPALIDAGLKVLTLDWTQVSALIGALVLAVGGLAWLLITSGKQREAECASRAAAVHAQLFAVLTEQVTSSTVAIDRVAAASEAQTKSTDLLCKAVQDLRDQVKR